MIKNYLTIAFRNLRRNKAYAAINVLGLSLGIACCMLIYTLVTYHLSFDQFHKNSKRIYRVVTEWHDADVDRSQAVCTPLGKAFPNDYTLAEYTARAIDYPDVLISVKAADEVKKFKEEKGVVYAEPAFFNIFDFPLEKGNPATILKSPDEVVITQKIARKYFGNEDGAMGKTIRVNNKSDFIVTGILKDIPANTDRKEEIYLSYANLKDQSKRLASDSNWGSVYSGSKYFMLLKPGISPDRVDNALKSMAKKYLSGRDAQTVIWRLQPLSDIHFNGDFDGSANKKYLWALVFIGIFLIITACVNFVNLATAQALNRSKEIGVRKVLGGLRSQLYWQFMAETALITVMATVIAIVLSSLILPTLNHLFKEEMSMHLLTNAPLISFLVVITGLVMFLSGSYPGIVLAKFQPVMALKSKITHKQVGGFSLRRVLVVVQFAISQMLIIGTIVIATQIRYSRNSALGFSKDAIVMLPVPMNDLDKMNSLKARLAQIPSVENLSLCFEAPASNSSKNTIVKYDSRSEDEHWEINVKYGDDRYLSTYRLQLAAGRNFYPSDTAKECLVNETFVKKLNIRSNEEVVGKTIAVNHRNLFITGVIRDFFTSSFHEAVTPVCLISDYKSYSNCAVKINPANMAVTLSSFKKIWDATYPEYLYNYQFLDERIAEFYRSDNIMLRLIEGFAAIAVFIGCLGLYGLVSFMAVRKTKEIGVRKVLGASVPNILWLFSKEFSRLLLIAFFLAAPIAGWVMYKYLGDFVYRIRIGAGIFLLAILCTFIIAAITVSYHSVRSVLMNPVKSLRTE